MFFGSWQDLFRVLILSLLGYVALLFLLRISGKRTLSKMNAFDFVVTVALGSTLATLMLSKQTALAEGVLALAMLIFMQLVVAWLSARSSAFGNLVKSQPRLLFYRGEFLREVMTQERVTEGEVLAAIREQNFPSIEGVQAVVLETAGTFSVLGGQKDDELTSLRKVKGARDAGATE